MTAFVIVATFPLLCVETVFVALPTAKHVPETGKLLIEKREKREINIL